LAQLYQLINHPARTAIHSPAYHSLLIIGALPLAGLYVHTAQALGARPVSTAIPNAKQAYRELLYIQRIIDETFMPDLYIVTHNFRFYRVKPLQKRKSFIPLQPAKKGKTAIVLKRLKSKN